MSLRSHKRNFLKPINSEILEKALDNKKQKILFKKNLLWFVLTCILLVLLTFDICYSCPIFISYYEYCEYILFISTLVNFLYYFYKLIIYLNSGQMLITLEQKRLLGVDDFDTSYKIVEPLDLSSVSPNVTPSSKLSNSYNLSDSVNYSLSSPSWVYEEGSPSKPSSPLCNSFKKNILFDNHNLSDKNFISNENDLNKYLNNFENIINVKNLSYQTTGQSSSLLSSFWSHPVSKTKDMSCFLKNCQYQLSSPSSNNSSSSKNEDRSTSTDNFNFETWNNINVDIVTLTRWNENLRKWISQTILERLIREFKNINISMERYGHNEFKIGLVSFDYLKQTAQIPSIANYLPSLVTLVPFMEVSVHQEYLEKRIHDLVKGGCMSNFRWNSGGKYDGVEWSDILPTDSAIIMHLFASYLDTQLTPLPSKPDIKPFSGFHYIKYNEKIPPLNSNSLYIQNVSIKPPHYRVILGETVYDMPAGYNNLFYTILYFIYSIYDREQGMLGRVHLGRAGVNMLWIIEKN